MNDDLSYSRELLGNFLKEIRERQGYSFRELGRVAGISGSHIYRMESAKFDCMLETFIKLTAALGIPPGWAIDRALGSTPWKFRDAISKHQSVERIYRRVGAHHKGKHAVDMFLGSLCSGAAQLLRAGNPLITLEHFRFDAELRSWFKGFAARLSLGLSFEERLAITKALATDGLPELVRLKICTEEKIAAYLKPYIERANQWPIQGSPKEVAALLTSKKLSVPVWHPSAPGFFDETFDPQKNLAYNDKPLECIEMPSTPTTIPQLIARVRILTMPRGSKAKLARTLGVLPQQINDWLKGKNAPGGEATLQLLKWVMAEEVTIQTKSNPGRALTRPGRMTRKRKVTTNEKPKSGQK